MLPNDTHNMPIITQNMEMINPNHKINSDKTSCKIEYTKSCNWHDKARLVEVYTSSIIKKRERSDKS